MALLFIQIFSISSCIPSLNLGQKSQAGENLTEISSRLTFVALDAYPAMEKLFVFVC
jgi:hypothetical protein